MKLKTYKYYNHKDNNSMVEVQADNILEADKIYEQQTGLNPIKTPHVGCEISKNKS